MPSEPHSPPARRQYCCPRCHHTIPLRLAKSGETCVSFTCSCGAEITGALEWPESQPEWTLQRLKDALTRSADPVEALELALPPRGTARTALPDRAHGPCLYETPLSQVMDSQVARRSNMELPTQGAPVFRLVKSVGAYPYDSRLLEMMASRQVARLQVLRELYAESAGEQSVSIEGFESLAVELVDDAVRDPDILSRLAMGLIGTRLHEHGLAVASIAISIGITLGWDEPTVRGLGMGCLLHDLGMQQVLDENQTQVGAWDKQALDEMLRHPIHSLERIEHALGECDLVTRMVLYQIHERCNGSGYPRRRTKPNIHPTARVAAVADAFVGMLSPRPHRPALTSYHALTHLLRSVRSGIHDHQAVRGLLETVSLFPIGMQVELSNGRFGYVLRANQGDYDRPVLWVQEADTCTLLDLRTHEGLHIRRVHLGSEPKGPAMANQRGRNAPQNPVLGGGSGRT